MRFAITLFSLSLCIMILAPGGSLAMESDKKATLANLPTLHWDRSLLVLLPVSCFDCMRWIYEYSIDGEDLSEEPLRYQLSFGIHLLAVWLNTISEVFHLFEHNFPISG